MSRDTSSLVKIFMMIRSVVKLLTDRQTDGRTDGQTDGRWIKQSHNLLGGGNKVSTVTEQLSRFMK